MTATSTTSLLCRFDYKYGDKNFRQARNQTFRQTRSTKTDYTSVDGQVVRKVETLWEWVDPIGAVAASPCAGPGYFFSDLSYRAYPSELFLKTHIKTTTYEAYGAGQYLLTLDDYNVLTGKTTRTVSIVDGAMPPVPTVKSSLSSLILQSFAGAFTDGCVAAAFVGKREAFVVAWAENPDDVTRAARRKMQRQTAVVRIVRGPADPLIDIGATVRLIDPARGVDANHMVVRRVITVDPEGGARGEYELEEWMR